LFLNSQNIPGGGNILAMLFAFETILLNGIGRQYAWCFCLTGLPLSRESKRQRCVWI